MGTSSRETAATCPTCAGAWSSEIHRRGSLTADGCRACGRLRWTSEGTLEPAGGAAAPADPTRAARFTPVELSAMAVDAFGG
jgi:hypothetical protein